MSKPATAIKNEGLEKFELSDYEGIKGSNYYEACRSLQRYIKRVIVKEDLAAVEKHLAEFGELASGRLNDLIIAAHQEGKYGVLEKFDRHGNRIDEIVYNSEQLELKQLAYDAGLANLDFQKDWGRPFHYEHREALAYLSNMNGEGGYNCPLAMTEGMIRMLRKIATEEQREKYLPKVTAPDAPYQFAAGQYLTERVGGSNVGANRTIARKGENGKWYLTGEKWFCSNPSELWVTTARIEGSETIGAFLVSRFKDNGELNDHHILRLKDIIGSRGKATAEVEYRDTEAELLGRPHTGLALLIKNVINVSRVHVGLAASAMARRGFLEARAYSRKRTAFNQTINKFASIQRKLASMQTMIIALELATFKNWSMHEAGDALFELTLPLMKYVASARSSRLVHDAIMIHGGNGILNDYSVLPRLLNDCIINETWEGTHNIIAGHATKALRRPRVKKALEELVNNAIKQGRAESELVEITDYLEKHWQELHQVDVGRLSEANRLPLCDKVFTIFTISLLIREAGLEPREAIYIDFARAFVDIDRYGYEGLLPESSVLLDEQKVMAMIDY